MKLWDRPALELPKGFANGGRELSLLGDRVKGEVCNGRNSYGSRCRLKVGQRCGGCFDLRPLSIRQR